MERAALQVTKDLWRSFRNPYSGITPVTFEQVPSRLPWPKTAYCEGESQMGEGVTQSGRGGLARAQRLKKALASGCPPAFVPRESAAPTGEGACSENSCSIPQVS